MGLLRSATIVIVSVVMLSILAENEIDISDFLLKKRNISDETKAFVIKEKKILEKFEKLKKAEKQKLQALENAIAVFS